MIYFLHLLFGFVVAFTVMISPGMLNMTALKISLDVGKVEGLKFVVGASIIIFLQVGIALFFADFFVNHPKIILIFEEIGVVVFLLLAIFFSDYPEKTPLMQQKK